MSQAATSIPANTPRNRPTSAQVAIATDSIIPSGPPEPAGSRRRLVVGRSLDPKPMADDAVLSTPAHLLSEDDSLEAAFEAALPECTALAFRVAFSVLRQREDAEDVAQEVLAKAFRGLRSLRGSRATSALAGACRRFGGPSTTGAGECGGIGAKRARRRQTVRPSPCRRSFRPACSRLWTPCPRSCAS